MRRGQPNFTPRLNRITPEIMRQLWKKFGKESQDLLALKCGGYTNQEIAEIFDISESAVHQRGKTLTKRIHELFPEAPHHWGQLFYKELCWAHGYNTALDDIRRSLEAKKSQGQET